MSLSLCNTVRVRNGAVVAKAAACVSFTVPRVKARCGAVTMKALMCVSFTLWQSQGEAWGCHNESPSVSLSPCGRVRVRHGAVIMKAFVRESITVP